jgi:hypothetical protein
MHGVEQSMDSLVQAEVGHETIPAVGGTRWFRTSIDRAASARFRRPRRREGNWYNMLGKQQPDKENVCEFPSFPGAGKEGMVITFSKKAQKRANGGAASARMGGSVSRAHGFAARGVSDEAIR